MKVLVACEFSGIVREAFRAKGHDAWSCDLLPTEIPGQHIQGDVIELLKASTIAHNHISAKPCAKQTTTAVVVNGDKAWIGSNWCENPQKECPRKDMPTGVGYDLCKNICRQPNHAEVDACLKAGEEARGGTLYLIGHTYCCEPCKLTMADYGISKTVFLPPSWDLMIAHPPCTHLAVSGARWFKDKQDEQKKALEFVFRLMTAPIPRIAIENPISIISSHIRKPDQIIQPWQFGHGETKATCLWLKNLPKLVPTNIVEGRANRIHREPPGPDRWKNRSRTFQGIAEAMAELWGNS